MMISDLLITVVLAVIAGAIVVPFAVGLLKGPAAAATSVPPDPPGAKLLTPLSRVATLYGRFLILYVIGELWRASTYRDSKLPIVCANTPYTTTGAGGSRTAVTAGASLHSNGIVQVCTAHPTALQWLLYALIRLPGLAVWALALLLIWQLIRQAARTGPFARNSAAIMYRLSLVILIGTAAAAAFSALGADLLDKMLLAQPGFDLGTTVGDVLIYAPLKALLPWPALAGAALLSFARITRAGAVLDEEVRATV